MHLEKRKRQNNSDQTEHKQVCGL